MSAPEGYVRGRVLADALGVPVQSLQNSAMTGRIRPGNCAKVDGVWHFRPLGAVGDLGGTLPEFEVPLSARKVSWPRRIAVAIAIASAVGAACYLVLRWAGS